MRARIASLACLALLAGCSVGPQYQRPELDVPASYRGEKPPPLAEPLGQGTLGELAWWEIYRDKALQELLQSALEGNRDVKIAAARVAEARAMLGVSRLAQLPQIDIDAGAERGRQVISDAYATGSVLTAQIEASYEVDLWRRLASLSDAAKANLLATQYGRDSVVVGLVSNVATAYFTLVSLDEQLRVTQATIADREKFLDLTQRMFGHGASSGLDVSRAQASLALARANVPDLQRQIALTENGLQILLGHNAGPVARPTLNLDDIPLPPAVPEGLPSSLLERRPDLRQAEQVLVGATANVRAAKAALFPTISLTGSFGGESFELSQLFADSSKVWLVGVSLLQPLLDAQRNGYQVDAARARETQALLQYQSAVAQAFREVADALAAREGYAGFLVEQRRQVDALREASERVLRRYRLGFSAYFEVIDADASLFTAQLQLIQAYRNSALALVQLYQALGGGWEAGSASARPARGSPHDLSQAQGH